ncbi:MAG: hypothetical protein ABI832_17955 [bacterium]
MQRRTFLQTAAAGLVAPAARAGTQIRRIDTQFIAALGGPDDTAGHNGQLWGLWAQDPGPRGVWLSLFPVLATTGYAPEGWKYDPAEWWMEEHGLIMETPEFPLTPGQYVVTGGRQVTSVLTVGSPDATGAQDWSLADGATLGEVTHLACRSARYRSAAGVCSPAQAQQAAFPVSPGATMPAVEGCAKQDFAVLFVIGMVEET